MPIQIKRGKTNSWKTSSNNKLKPGQLGLEETPSGSLRLKSGYGSEEKQWSALPYLAPNQEIYQDNKIAPIPTSSNTLLDWNSTNKTASSSYDITVKSIKANKTSTGSLNLNIMRNISIIAEGADLPDPSICGPEGSLLIVYSKGNSQVNLNALDNNSILEEQPVVDTDSGENGESEGLSLNN